MIEEQILKNIVFRKIEKEQLNWYGHIIKLD